MLRNFTNRILTSLANGLRAQYGDSFKKKSQNYDKARKHMIKTIMKRGIISEKSVKMHGVFITFFGCGKFKYGPGSFTSFICVIIWFLATTVFFKMQIENSSELFFWLAICAVLFIYGVLYIPLYSRNFEREDHPSIVIDEVVGQLMVLCLTYPFVKKYYFIETSFLSKLIMCAHIFSCFVFFRFFDIVKPSFIGWIDRNIKSSFGIMFDDLVSALAAVAINFIIFFLYENAIWQLHS